MPSPYFFHIQLLAVTTFARQKLEFWQQGKDQRGLFTLVMVEKATWACGMNMARRQS